MTSFLYERDLRYKSQLSQFFRTKGNHTTLKTTAGKRSAALPNGQHDRQYHDVATTFPNFYNTHKENLREKFIIRICKSKILVASD